ncbi:hypothetical protein J2046_006798 [Rhizobium petrolearium]|uniref:hypothetical protein n=1 Tax=Neorhizobium petrolearium TaxID=515361 RepID=UPI001AE7DBC4|nr:hypothetical protein [Neorhizobium petrolearium]MBP1848502.1 hypothetical protein [Neorhizobium petrolearium]
MTAFIFRPFRDRVEILSDGAAYTPDGILVGISDKVRRSEFIPLAIVGSGPVPAIDALADVILKAAEVTGSVDETIELLSGSLAACAEAAKHDSPVRIAMGGISETRGPLCWNFQTFEDDSGAAFELRESPTGFLQGEMPGIDELPELGLTFDDMLGPLEKAGPAIFEYMRHRKRPSPVYPTSDPFYNVGGFLDLVTVTADGYEQKRLVTWPDEVGWPIRSTIGVKTKPPEGGIN